MSDGERPGGSLEMGTARTEAFSDGVMAVIITIMALELRAPEGATLEAVGKRAARRYAAESGSMGDKRAV